MPASHYEPGTYRGVVTAQRFGVTPNGSDFFAIEFEPTEATGANTLPGQIYRREVTLYFTEKAAKYSIDNLRRIGWDGVKLSQLDPDHPQHNDLAGTELELVCSINDKGYDEWNLTAPGAGAAKESDKSVAAKLDKLFGKQLMAAMPAGAKKAAPAKKPAPQTVPDDDDSDPPF